MRMYLTEFIGTFFLVLTVGLSVASAGAMAPLAIGAILMVMVYMGGHISGGHYNPAVSLAVLLRGKLAPADFAAYVVAQLVGGFAAAALSAFLTGACLQVVPGLGEPIARALLVEIVFTFALALVVLNTATSARTAGNSYFGLAIGFTVTAGAYAGAGISGGAFNPAVGLGPNLYHLICGGSIAHAWIYVVGPLAGGALAAIVFRIQEAE